MQKVYQQAPLPFVGQKRFFLNDFRQALSHIPGDGDGWTIVDVFGGSGLLSHTAKREKPAARVIYNDFDNYCERLNHMADYNRLREQLAVVIGDLPKAARLDDARVAGVKRVIEEFDGYIDLRVLGSWLLFSAKQADSIDTLLGYEFYNKLRLTPLAEAADYLDGLEVVRRDFSDLMAEYGDSPNTLFVLDPPYLSTMQGAYAGDAFRMVSFLRMIKLTRPPFVIFSSTRSELMDYFDYLAECAPEEYARFDGFEIVRKTAKMARGIEYEDNMLFKI